jgi:aminoglycoside phosphotransferase (APT) family kinase protein
MTTMHAGQLEIDADLVRRLIQTQWPHWANLAVRPVVSGGTANAIFRLGDGLAVRMPLSRSSPAQIDKEHRWLPGFAELLPLSIPVPLAKGQPSESYPCHFTVCQWLDGENPLLARLADPVRSAEALAGFIRALQQIDPTGGPGPGAHNFDRGNALRDRDASTRGAIARSVGLVDVGAVTKAWEADLSAPVWDRAPVWVHGDLLSGNLLATDGQLSGVIDWGGLGVGDPAVELLPAWNLFEGESRRAFRAALGVDGATWARGRGLALSIAIVALPCYIDTNPVVVRWARRMIGEVLDDGDKGGRDQ